MIATLDRQIQAVLTPLVADYDCCALLGFPNHNNVGDSAIWLGERAFLDRHGIDVVYISDLYTHDSQAMARRLGDGVILLHGGGNLGDVWPVHQEFRERIVGEFPKNRIVQLPQSIYFSDERAESRAAELFSAHPDLTILARDQRSKRLAIGLGAKSELCPDMAFVLGPLERRKTPAVDVLWLARTDVEASPTMAARAAADAEVVDWLLPSDDRALGRRWAAIRVRMREAVNSRTAENAWASGILRTVVPRSFDPLARRRVTRGCDLLARGRVVITDRLHGHILCTLLGMPHVVMDNSYGKIRDFLAAFTGGCQLVHVAETPEKALAQARALAVVGNPGRLMPRAAGRNQGPASRRGP